MHHNYLKLKIWQHWSEKLRLPCLLSAVMINILVIFYIFTEMPFDYQQEDAVRIIYLHVPSAWFALLFYVIIGFCSIMYLIYRSIILHILAQAIAPVGAIFTFTALLTGSIWAKPMWGTWWVWDARLTSMVVLLLFYLGYLALNRLLSSYREQNLLASASLAVLGLVNVPIVKFSVDIWNSLHQPASILRSDGLHLETQMLFLLLIISVSLFLYSISIIMTNLLQIMQQHKIRNLAQRKI